MSGVRVSELINIRIEEVDFERCQNRINSGKGGKDRIVPFPISFKEVLAMHVDKMQGNEPIIYLSLIVKVSILTEGLGRSCQVCPKGWTRSFNFTPSITSFFTDLVEEARD